MNSFKIISDNKASFVVDTKVFSMDVVRKVLYWLSNTYIIQSTSNGNNVYIEITSMQSFSNWLEVEKTVSQMFCDFALRETISEETKDIRNILYIKAFSNVDDYYEYEFSEK